GVLALSSHSVTLPRTPRSYACEVVEGQTLLFNGFQVHPRPGHAVVLDAEDDHAAELEHGPAAGGAVGTPLAPDRVAVLDGGGNLDPEVRDVGDDLGPVRAHVLAARHGRAGMARPLADV